MSAAAPATTAPEPLAPLLSGAEAQQPDLPLRTHFCWTLAGNVAYAACQWAMLVVLARLGTADHVGQLVLGLAVTAPVMLFASLKLRSVQATDARREFAFRDYFALRLLSTGAGLAIVAGIALLAGYDRKAALVILAVGAAKGLESISDILHGLLQQHERMDWIARSMMLKGVLSLGALAAAFKLTHSVVYATLAMAVAFGMVLVVYDVPVCVKALKHQQGGQGRIGLLSLLRPRWHPATLWALLALTIPLGLALAASSLSVNVPRYFVASARGEGDLGIFGALASPLAAGYLIIHALTQSAAPRLARHHSAGARRAFDRTVGRLVCAGFLVGAAGLVAAWLFGRPLLRLMFGPEYALHSAVFVWLVAAAAVQFGYVFLGSAINAMRYFGRQLPMNLVGPAFSALACFFLVPRYGLRGAAWAVFIGTSCEGLTYLVFFLWARRRAARAAVNDVPKSDDSQTGVTLPAPPPARADI